MGEPAQSNSLTAKLARSALLIAIGLALLDLAPYLLRAAGAGAWAKPFLGSHASYEIYVALWFFGAAITVMAIWRSGPGRALRELALVDVAPLGCAVCLAAIAAALGVLLYAGARYQAPDRGELLLFCFVGPFVEEVFFRGFLFRQLRRWAGLPFVYAALLSSLVFGAEHFEQADTLMGSLMNSGITFGGGFLFCWLVERWGSVWPGYFIHAGLNIVWTLFTLGDNAVGGTMGNLARLATIVVAIAGTLALTRRPKSA